MVDISVEILSTSVPVLRESLRYKIKTWWSSVDANDGSQAIRLPTLPMIQNYYQMNGKKTIVFVEMWYRNAELFPQGAMRFLGLVKQQVDDQLKNPSLNPSVEFLEVYDPLEDIIRGRLLLKIDAVFQEGPTNPNQLNPLPITFPDLDHNNIRPASAANSHHSSYFNRSIESVLELPKYKHSLCVHSTPSAPSSEASNKEISSVEHNAIKSKSSTKEPVENVDSDSKGACGEHDIVITRRPASSKKKSGLYRYETAIDDLNLDLEIAKAQKDLAARDKERDRKNLKDQETSARESPSSSIAPSFGDVSPITNSSCHLPNEMCPTHSNDTSLDDVIKLINSNLDSMKKMSDDAQNPLSFSPDNQVEDSAVLQPVKSKSSSQRPQQRTSQRSNKKKYQPNSSAIQRIFQSDLTIYGFGIQGKSEEENSESVENASKRPITSLNFPLVEEQRNKEKNEIPKENSDNRNANITNYKPRPISRRCAAAIFSE